MNKIPEISRARGYYVYTANGKRYLDMALEGGRLIMGHRQKGYALAMKNAIDKGILSCYPSPYAGRLKKAVKELLGKECFVYLLRSEERAREILKQVQDDASVQTLLLPVPAAFAPGVVVSAKELELVEEPVSPVFLAGAVRALYNLKAFLEKADYSAWEKAGIAYACKGKWRVGLPYLYPLCTPDQYPAVWNAFFEAGIMLSPDYDKPSVLPPYDELAEGMRKKVLKL
ncbi:MAG: hypothetical protein IJM77_06820, partial [Spirochaetia bacterium]|nr:hypothetical protein [Spirochaetia bacterium]